ncbi:MAG: serine hydrolase [Pseudomonadota bacterium]
MHHPGRCLTLVVLVVMAFQVHVSFAEDDVMVGVPAAPETQVTLMNQALPPFSRWGFRNMSVQPAVMVPRSGPIYEIPYGEPIEIELLTFEHDGQTMTVLEALEAENTDGFLVIKDGAIVYERYFGDFTEHSHHLWASSTKSLVSMAVGILIEEGKIDPEAKVPTYVPELAEGAFADLTVGEVLNMVSAIDYSEDYANLTPGSVHYEYFRRIGLTPAFDLMQIDPAEDGTPRGTLEFLPEFQSNPDLEPSYRFEYHSPNVDVIGWIIARVSGTPLNDFVAANIWSKIGAEHDAFFTTDLAFVPVATGGFNSTLRDFARFGLAVLDDGTLNGVRIFPAAYTHAIPAASDDELLFTDRSAYKADGSAFFDDLLQAYRNFWWIHDRDLGVFTARGVFGQVLYVDRNTNTVIATFSSAPTASNAARPENHAKMAAMKMIAEM